MTVMSPRKSIYDSERLQCTKCLFVSFSAKTNKCPFCGFMDDSVINGFYGNNDKVAKGAGASGVGR